MNIVMIEFLEALPDGEVFATVPGGQSEAIGLGSTTAVKPAPFSVAVAWSTGAHLTLGTPVRCPYASLSLGFPKPTAVLPAIPSAKVCATA
jgi:hypothetical protein